MARLLISAGANVNTQSSPLLSAIDGGGGELFPQFIRLLVENGEFAGFKREDLPKRQPRDYFTDPTAATPRDDNAFWNAFRKRNPDWRGD